MTLEAVEVEAGLKGRAGSVDELTAADDLGGCVGLQGKADNAAYPETIHDARLKKMRKAESMGTTTAEPHLVPETKMRRVDGTPSVESEDETNVSPAKLWIYSEEVTF